MHAAIVGMVRSRMFLPCLGVWVEPIASRHPLDPTRFITVHLVEFVLRRVVTPEAATCKSTPACVFRPEASFKALESHICRTAELL
jgi:hypothetical protein